MVESRNGKRRKDPFDWGFLRIFAQGRSLTIESEGVGFFRTCVTPGRRCFRTGKALRGCVSQSAAVWDRCLARFSPVEKAAFTGINRDKSR